jgi:internalin A
MTVRTRLGVASIRPSWLGCLPWNESGAVALRRARRSLVARRHGTDVTDAGLAHLEASTKPASLDLCGTDITDAGLAHLHGLTKLSFINLRNTEITDAGAGAPQGPD